MDMEKYYQQLIGATVKSFTMIKEEYALDNFPCYMLELADGSMVQFEVSRDEEGNGGGFLFISPIKAGGDA